VSHHTRASPRPLAAVIFDLGGTLISSTSTEEDNAVHLETRLRAQGWPPAFGPAIREARRWMFEMSWKTGRQYTMEEALRRAIEQIGRPVPDREFFEAAERVFFEPELAGYRVFPDALPLLRRLRAARVRLACVSNASSHWLIEQIVDRMGFRPYLDPVVSSAGFGWVKPDPGIFRSVLSRWGVTPDRAAMIGDTLGADILGGRSVGMRTIYVTMAPNPNNVYHRHIRADAEAATLGEAERILFRWIDYRSA
jgi:putative hydrolase of the HAD superfamily